MADHLYTFEPVGVLHSPYREKFGIPRQPGLARHAHAELRLSPPYNHPDSVRGLESFSHVWLLFAFHHTAEQGWKPTVRPPRCTGAATTSTVVRSCSATRGLERAPYSPRSVRATSRHRE